MSALPVVFDIVGDIIVFCVSIQCLGHMEIEYWNVKLTFNETMTSCPYLSNGVCLCPIFPNPLAIALTHAGIAFCGKLCTMAIFSFQLWLSLILQFRLVSIFVYNFAFKLWSLKFGQIGVLTGNISSCLIAGVRTFWAYLYSEISPVHVLFIIVCLSFYSPDIHRLFAKLTLPLLRLSID